jgi:hypothetical protein
MNASKSGQQAIILDSCNSEAFGPEYQAKSAPAIDFQGQLGAKGRVVLASSAFSERSYERKGDRLSVYTQHLVEGMTTGKADLDHDGYISMQDLHDYAINCFRSSDVEMTPKMIVLKGEGHKLLLSRVKSVDASQYYRDALGDLLKQGNGEISAIDRYKLFDLRIECGLSAETADHYEELAIKPYREREKKIELFKYQVTDVILSGNRTDQETEAKLSQIRQSYCKVLTTEDMTAAEAEIRQQIEAFPGSDVSTASFREGQVPSSSVSQASASQSSPTSDTIKSTGTAEGALFMKTWMRLGSGIAALCGFLAIGYALSTHPQSQQSQNQLQESSTLQLKAPGASASPNVIDEAERIRQKNLEQMSRNLIINRKALEQADAALKKDDWNSWQLAKDYATQALNSEDPLQRATADKIISEVQGKMADETRRVNEANNARKVRSSSASIVSPSPALLVNPSPAESEKTCKVMKPDIGAVNLYLDKPDGKPGAAVAGSEFKGGELVERSGKDTTIGGDVLVLIATPRKGWVMRNSLDCQ